MKEKSRDLINRLTRYGKRLWTMIWMPEMKVLPGQLAFFTVLSIVPIFALIAFLGDLLSFTDEEILNFISGAFPDSITNFFTPILTANITGNMFIFLVTAFLLSLNGLRSIVYISDELYNIESHSYLKGSLKGGLMTIIILVLIIFMVLVPGFGTDILNFIKNHTNNVLMEDLIDLFNLAKWPLSFIFLYINIKLIYVIAPNKKVRFKEVRLGAMFTTLGWMIALAVYSYFVVNFTQYDIFYGSLSNIIILMLWIYILSFIFVLGMAINASRDNSHVAEIANNKNLKKVKPKD